ncbi:hypothetical protein ACP4OV_004164 [Aristida adscensionis]
MAKPRTAAASPSRDATRPSTALSRAVRRRAAAVSEELASRGLGAFVWGKKLDRDLSRGLLPDIVSLRSERRRCLARRKEAAIVKASAAASRRRASSPPPIPDASAARAAAEEEAKEAAFLLEQSRIRAAIRFAEGRPRRIDVLVESLRGTRRCALAAFRGASAEELRELGEEIAAQAGVDKANGAFWEAAKVTCDAEISKAAGAGTFLHSEVAADVRSVVEEQSLEELDAMQRAIAAQVAAGEAKIVEHWQEVAELIRAEKAKKLLAQSYSSCADDAPRSFDGRSDAGRERQDGVVAGADEEGSEPLCPVALPAARASPAPAGTAAEWRKPRYVARVRTGYEWNKYNRVHYDRDHPPPKIVKGYKFVLHYPGLAGERPPQFAVEEDGGGGETCIVRFHAGWPYEDVAFRIVNREWERSRKCGFRCTFERGILHLNFNFKRFFYKR